jgi:hypothetical protein
VPFALVKSVKTEVRMRNFSLFKRNSVHMWAPDKTQGVLEIKISDNHTLFGTWEGGVEGNWVIF